MEMGLDDETVGKLLDKDKRGVRRVEEAFEGLVGWMKGDTGGAFRGRGLLGSILFGVMEEECLEENKFPQVLCQTCGGGLEGQGGSAGEGDGSGGGWAAGGGGIDAAKREGCGLGAVL